MRSQRSQYDISCTFAHLPFSPYTRTRTVFSLLPLSWPSELTSSFPSFPALLTQTPFTFSQPTTLPPPHPLLAHLPRSLPSLRLPPLAAPHLSNPPGPTTPTSTTQAPTFLPLPTTRPLLSSSFPSLRPQLPPQPSPSSTQTNLFLLAPVRSSNPKLLSLPRTTTRTRTTSPRKSRRNSAHRSQDLIIERTSVCPRRRLRRERDERRTRPSTSSLEERRTTRTKQS